MSHLECGEVVCKSPPFLLFSSLYTYINEVLIKIKISVIPTEQPFDLSEVVCCLCGPFKELR